EKYQARYNEVVDEATAASVELTGMAPILEGIQNNLKLLSKTVPARIEGLIQLRSGKTGKLLLKAALKGLILTFLIAVVLTWTLPRTSPIFQSDVPLLIIYAGATAFVFFRERRKQLEVPLGALKSNTDNLKNLALAYVYEDQLP